MESRRRALIDRARPLLAFAGRYFKPLAAVATIVGLTVALWRQREAIAEFDWTLSPAATTGAVLLFAVAPVVQGVSFWLILRTLGVPSRLDDALLVWMRSFLLRYAPSGALAFVVRVRERERLRATRAHVLTATGYEQLVVLVAGAVVCLSAFALTGAWPPLAAIGIAAVAAGIAVAARPSFLGTWLQRQARARGIDVPALMRGRFVLAVVLLNAVAWLATGAATWLLTDALASDETPGLAWLVGVYSFAWVLGLVVPILPGGLGLRDATLAAFLATAFGAGVAAALALALRLANTLGELVAIGAVEAVYRLRRGRPDLTVEAGRGQAR
jgi:uncharacterized membrane protein YbhN (UPF0104 family)